MNNPKELQIKIEQLRKEIDDVKINTGFDSSSKIAKKQSEIFVLASQLAEISSSRMEKQTNKLIFLTWVLVGLTVSLLFFTAYLSYDAYLNNETKQETYPHTTK
jgi:uncharacterized membrane protein